MSVATLRTSSRLAAVQAHYELDMVGGDARDVLREFAERRWHEAATADRAGDSDASEERLDQAFFEDLMSGAAREQAELDGMIREALVKSDSFERLEALVRAILRVAAYELAHRLDVPAKVVLSEYVELAKDFFDGSQVRLINGVLDALGKRLRKDELGERTGTTD